MIKTGNFANKGKTKAPKEIGLNYSENGLTNKLIHKLENNPKPLNKI